MSFEEFEHQARLYVLGTLEDEELMTFEAARREHGAAAEKVIKECQRLNSVFALTLRPHPPKHDAKARLMALIQKASPASQR